MHSQFSTFLSCCKFYAKCLHPQKRENERENIGSGSEEYFKKFALQEDLSSKDL